MEAPFATRTIQVKRKKTLADGTIKEYTENKTYKLKGYAKADGTRTLKMENELIAEQKAEIRQKYEMGVKIKRLQVDYNVSYSVIKKVLVPPK